MRKKIIGILICIMLLITSALTTLIIPEDTNVVASSEEESKEEMGLDMDYIWTQLGDFSNVIYDAYLPSDIPKGRSFGSKGGNYTIWNILEPEMRNTSNLTNIKIERLQTIDALHNNYSSIINVSDFSFTVNSIGTQSYLYENPIPKKEMFPIAVKTSNISCWNDDYGFSNVEIRPINMTKIFPIWGIFEESIKNIDFEFLNNDYSPLLGNVTYISQNGSIPSPVEQYARVFLLDDVNGVQEKLENITNASGVIVIDTGNPRIADASDCPCPAVLINNTNGNVVKELLEDYTVVVDNVRSFSRKLTFTYDPEESSRQPYFVIDRIPDYNEFLKFTKFPNICNNLFYNIILLGSQFKLVRQITGLSKLVPGFQTYLTCLQIKTSFLLSRNISNCVGVILYDSHDYHFMWSMNTQTMGIVFDLPTICVNKSVGEFLRNNCEDFTLSGYISQEYLEENVTTPGAIGENIYGNITIDKSPSDMIAIVSNRYDGMFGQTSGDSAVGTAIVLGLAKFFKDHPSVKPKYNLTFLFTTAEEYGFHGARYHCDKHIDQKQKVKYWLMLDQLGFKQEDCQLCIDYNDTSNNSYFDKILDQIREDSGYPEDKTIKRTGEEISSGSEQATVDKRFTDTTTIGLVKDQDRRWDQWHRAGNNYTEGDSLKNIDRDDVNATARLTLGLVKYFMINPDCWFNGSVTYTAEDSPYDIGDENDSINVTISLKSSLPQDRVRVNATMKSCPSNTTVFWKNYDFNITSGGTQKTLIVTLPPNSTGATNGNYSLTLNLLNSTGRINDITLNTRVYNDTDTQSGYVYLCPRNNSIPNKPRDITGPSEIPVGEPANYTTNTTDSNLDQLQYQWAWRRDLEYLWILDTTETGPYDSGQNCTVEHTYCWCGWKKIQVRAREDFRYLFDGSPMGWDRYGTWSEWSDPHYVLEQFLTSFDMSCTVLSSAVNAQSATELPSIQQLDSIYEAIACGGTEPYNYTWTFNHERYAKQQKTVNYSFDESGNYSVVLNVTDSNDYCKEFSVNVSVVNLSASFNLSIPSPFAEIDENITFTDTSAVASGYNMTIWTWDFDDGTISYDRNVTHAFTQEGFYNVSLTVMDNQSNSDVSNRYILVFIDETPPEIQQINDEINVKNRWLEVMIAGLFNDMESGINHTMVNITYPNGTHANYTMNHFVNDTYWYVFNDTAQTGQYNYTIWVTDYEKNTNTSTGYSFTIPTPPVLFYATTTPTDDTISNDPWADINVTILDPVNTSAFIDWDHSLKGYWPMESYNDTGVYDNSTYENFGTFQNGMNTRNIIAGKYGDGLEFDGSDDYVDVGTSDSLDLGTGDFTFMVWEKSHTTLYSKKAMILTNNPASESWKGYGFGIINSPYLIVSQSAGSNVTLQGTTDVTDNTWHHIAYVCRSGAYSIYVDGEEDASSGGIAVKNITNAQHTMIAYDGHCSSWCYFEGALDEPQLYNRALSWEEINASYNNGINRLSHNFTGLSDGTYSYSAHAIDTTGNQSSTETRQILIDTTPPTITDVTASPHTVGFGYPVTITADIVDNGSGVDLVTVQIAHPDGGNSSNHTMTFVGNDTYQFVFTDTWLVGQYNYTIWAMDNAYNINISTGHHFHVSADVSISIATLQDSYTSNQYINITDPPNPPENYTLVGRGLTWDEYYNALTGQNILETYQGPVNYQEENEIWTPINNTISQLAENHPAYVYGYRSGNNRGLYGAYFKSNAQQEWPVAFTFNRSDDPTIYAIRSKLVGVGYVDPQSNWAYQYLQNVQSSQGQVSDYSITYPAVFTGTDVTWSYGNVGLKEEITLSNTTKTILQNHPPSQYGLNDASSYLVFITKLDYQNLNLYNDSGLLEENVTISENGVEFRDLLGQFKCALPLGEAYELNNESARQNLTYRIIHLNGNTYLLSGLKVSDLNAMTFPVVIDPTLTVYSNSNDGYIYSYSSASYSAARNATSGTIFNTSSSITIGQYKRASPTYYYVYRGYLFFNTTALPQNAYIDNATLSLYKYLDSSTTDFEITVQNGQPTYPHNPLQTTDYNKNLYSGNGGSKNTSSLGTGYNAIYLNSDGKSWMNRTGWTKLCLRSNRDINGYTPTGNEHVYVYSSEQGLGYQPKLVITYRNQSKIKNTGSTDITGYLLLQIQFYDSGKGTAPHWIIDNDTINETTTRTIISGNQLALDTIFNGHVRASDLTHGTGTYRVYAVFRDPEGNILRTNDGSELKAWWQFSKT